jgi:NDP-sugar pyrophosphorylase family protein
MSVIITMAGAGSRFSRAGYSVPKYMIHARSRTLFDWSMQSLCAFHDHEFVFACLQGQDESWIRKRALHNGIRNVKVVARQDISLGQAHTAQDVVSHVDPNEAVWIYNIDTYIQQGIEPHHLDGYEGCLHVFESNSPAMSYVRMDGHGNVVQIAEKVVISQWATAGIYGFASAQLFSQSYRQTYGAAMSTGEHYVAPLYQTLLQMGARIHAPKLQLSDVHVLGTPEEVAQFDPAIRPPLGAP